MSCAQGSGSNALLRDCDEWLRRLPAAIDAALSSLPVPHASVYTRVERVADALSRQGGTFVPVRLCPRSTRPQRGVTTTPTAATTMSSSSSTVPAAVCTYASAAATNSTAAAAATTTTRAPSSSLHAVPAVQEPRLYDSNHAVATTTMISSGSSSTMACNRSSGSGAVSSDAATSSSALRELKTRMKVVSLQLRQAQQRRDDLLLAEDEDNDASDALARADADIRQLEEAFRQLRAAQATLLQRASNNSDAQAAGAAAGGGAAYASSAVHTTVVTSNGYAPQEQAYSAYNNNVHSDRPRPLQLHGDVRNDAFATAPSFALASSMLLPSSGGDGFGDATTRMLSATASSSFAAGPTPLQRSGFSWEAYEQQGGLQNLTREALSATADVVLPVNPTHAYAGERFAWSRELRRTMRDVFGLHEYRHCQLEIINACMDGRDVFVLLPTGGGKSLCYQLPALLPNPAQVTVVFSPLLSLIQDQVYALVANDIPAMALTGQCTDAARRALFAEWAAGHIVHTLVYVTPEYFGHSDHLMRQLRSLAERGLLNRFVIDEAHCISQWGHDFRRDYRKLTVLKTQFAQTPITALTATATAPVQQDIIKTLSLRDAIIFRGSFNRANLRYVVQRVTGKEVVSVVRELVKTRFARSACGIVYCLSKRDCEDMAAQLSRDGVRAAYYHASASNKNEKQERWTRDEVQVICATIAFGMGINKPDVRFVIHAAMPKSLEGYYQESGRAGRDGLASECILLCSSADRQRQERLIHGSNDWRASLTSLYRMLAYTMNNVECRRRQQLMYFGEDVPLHYCLEQQQQPQQQPQQQQQQQVQPRQHNNTTAMQMCDNCASKLAEHWTVRTEDVTAVIVDLFRILVHLGSMTGKQLVAVYRGTASELGKVIEARMRQKGAPAQYKSGAKRTKELVERALLEALLLGVLRERLESVNDFVVCAFVEPGGDGAAVALLRRLERNEQRVTVYVRGERVLPPPPPPVPAAMTSSCNDASSTTVAADAAAATTRKGVRRSKTRIAAAHAVDNKENEGNDDDDDDVPLSRLYSASTGTATATAAAAAATASTTAAAAPVRGRRRTLLTLSSTARAAGDRPRRARQGKGSKYVMHESSTARRADNDAASSSSSSVASDDDEDDDMASFIDDGDTTTTTTTQTMTAVSADVTPHKPGALRKRARMSTSLSSCVSSSSSSSVVAADGDAATRAKTTTAPAAAAVRMPAAQLQQLRSALQAELEALVKRLAEYAEGGRQYNVMPKKTIQTLVDTLTQPRWGSVEQFVDLEGMGKNKVRRFGADILALYRRFRCAHVGDVTELTPHEADALRQVKATVTTTSRQQQHQHKQQQQQQRQQQTLRTSSGHTSAANGNVSCATAADGGAATTTTVDAPGDGGNNMCHTPPQQQQQQAVTTSSGVLLLDADTPVRPTQTTTAATALLSSPSRVTPERGHALSSSTTTSMTQPRRTVFSFAATRDGGGVHGAAAPPATASNTATTATLAPPLPLLPSQSLPLFPDPQQLQQQQQQQTQVQTPQAAAHSVQHALLGAVPTQAPPPPPPSSRTHATETATHSTDYLFSLCEQAQRRTPLRAATPPPLLAATAHPVECAHDHHATIAATRPRRQSAKDLLAALGKGGSSSATSPTMTTTTTTTTDERNNRNAPPPPPPVPVYSVDDDV